MRFNFNQQKNLTYRVAGMMLSIVIFVGILIIFLALVKLAWWYLRF